MDISHDQKTTTDGLIRIKVTESDYQPKVEEKVRDYSRKASIKGFRQGKVPHGVIRKMFGRSILVEEVNHLISHSISEYIKNKKLRVLGDPMPNQEKARLIDWETQKDFEFEFEIGLAEDFTVDVSSKVKVKKYIIEINQKTMDETLDDIKKRYGKVSYPETSEESDNLVGEITPVAGGEPRHSFIAIEKILKKERKTFIGLKKEDSAEFEVNDLFDNEEVKERVLGVGAGEAKSITGKYRFKVNTISRVEPAEINQELFDKVFGKDLVKDEGEFQSKIKETIAGNYERETDHLLEHEIQHHLLDHTKINLPENFLKSWLKTSSEGKVTDELLEKEFKEYSSSLQWDLIKNKIAEDLGIKVEAAEVKEKAKALISDQFGGPAFAEQFKDKLDAFADNYLAGKEGQNYSRLYSQLRHEKIMKTIKGSITISEKNVGLEEFREIALEHRH